MKAAEIKRLLLAVADGTDRMWLEAGHRNDEDTPEDRVWLRRFLAGPRRFKAIDRSEGTEL